VYFSSVPVDGRGARAPLCPRCYATGNEDWNKKMKGKKLRCEVPCLYNPHFF